MARPRKAFALTIEERGALNLIAWGRATVAEAARMLQIDRSTMLRMCASLGVDTTAGRRKHLAHLALSLSRYGRRPLTKADLTARGERALAEWKRDS